MTREELIAAATVLHDEECRSCDRKYRMSCPNMANAILRSGPAATAAAAMPDAITSEPPGPPRLPAEVPLILAGLDFQWAAEWRAQAGLDAS